MNTITKLIVLASLCLIMGKAQGQDTIQKTKTQLKIESFKQYKETIEKEEKTALKTEVEEINQRLEKGEITAEKAETLKQEKAKKRALNIENRLAIIDHQIALLERNDEAYGIKNSHEKELVISIGKKKGLRIKNDNGPPKYDIKTGNQLLFAIGFNNTIIDGESLDDSPYELGGSGFVEIGWIWNTRLLKNSNFVRVNYGLSMQWNKLSIKNNNYFVENGDETTLEAFPFDLKKSKFRTTSFVVPLHFEFGPSDLKDYGDRIRYFTDNHFKIGIGGFAGVNLSAMQKLKYKEDGDRQKEKIKSDFNTTNLVYGLSGYIGVGDFSIYAKYNLNELFKDQAVDQHNVSLGLRWALD
ncbi:hypothetical protein LX77_02451 [Gelidibacter algens]|uniref:Outer membrane protein with beta-barrel domain n=1 Tax=Gelidibacter algens TaxID=49280 RepID=A0A1A7R047_9FLAO|nr:hypothetical protein [Gelidibacter algens]OBX25186.1 hypothetical protein A9996_11250 [Gelidibacter algens]RAJ22505.1 hypothetical protein LX77_02451 [Gelidibacter algens]